MGLIDKIRLGMTRKEVADVLGDPDDTGATSRKYRTPAIYKYGEIELHFEPWKSGTLTMVYTEDEISTQQTLFLSVTDRPPPNSAVPRIDGMLRGTPETYRGQVTPTCASIVGYAEVRYLFDRVADPRRAQLE